MWDIILSLPIRAESPYTGPMKMERFSPKVQDGLRLWCQEAHGAEPSWLDNMTKAVDWAWVYFLLLASENRMEWFPYGKAATLSHLAQQLIEAAGPLVGRTSIPGDAVRELAKDGDAETRDAATYKHVEEAGDVPVAPTA